VSLTLLALLFSLPLRADGAMDGHACLDRADLVCAQEVRDRLLRTSPGDAATLHLDLRTRFHEGRYDEAAELLGRLKAQGQVPQSLAQTPIEASALAAEGFLEARGEGVRVRYAQGVDLVLRDEAIEVLEQSRQVIDGLLGGGPTHEITLDIFPDGRRFIQASGLPEEAVRTTGVIALSKWTRLLLTSPRALGRGYGWKDTIAHEYIHLVIAWRTQERSPVWLHEGLAKHLEGYWRGDRSGGMSVYQQGLLAEALRTNSFVPFEKFRYSMAYLDSGEEAALAFAQVGTMVQFLVESKGIGVLPGLLDAIREGQTADQAFAEVAGFADFDLFRAAWLDWVRRLPLVERSLAALPVVLDDPGEAYADDPVVSKDPKAAKYLRLGDLLREAKRCDAALIQYDRAREPKGPESPLLLARIAVCNLDLRQLSAAREAADEAVELYPEFTLAQTTLARVRAAQGDTRGALSAWTAAHDLNPFDPEVQAALTRGHAELGQDDLAARHERYGRILATGGVLSSSSVPPEP